MKDINEVEENRVKQYFKENPHEVKYDRKISGFDSSYLKSPNGRIIRLANKSEKKHILGEGEFGRVKKSESSSETSVKIQKAEDSPRKINEAEISLDLGVAVSPLIKRLSSNQDVKIYQEMQQFGETLEDRISLLSEEERFNVTINFLILVNELHNGGLSKTQKKYTHGDLHLGNVIFDKQGNLKLIDFGYTKLFEEKNLAFETQQVLYAVIDILGKDKIEQFPPSLQELLDPKKLKIEGIKFLAAALISYKDNPSLSTKELTELKTTSSLQTMLIEQYKEQTKNNEDTSSTSFRP